MFYYPNFNAEKHSFQVMADIHKDVTRYVSSIYSSSKLIFFPRIYYLQKKFILQCHCIDGSDEDQALQWTEDRRKLHLKWFFLGGGGGDYLSIYL